MKLIESKAEYLPQENGIEGIYKMIEIAGRTAYNSQDKITPTSAKDFVDRMIKSKHGAALEHGTVYIAIPGDYVGLHSFYILNPYSKTTDFNIGISSDGLYVSTNMRVLQENNHLDDLKYLCSPTEFHEKRYAMRFTCSRAIAQELTRHRTFSFLMESQRYINYSKERHGGEITFIEPSWKKEKCPGYFKLRRLCEELEKEYMELIEWGYTPQQARDVLPNATKTELIMTGFSSDWRHVLDLRLFEKTGAVHPDMLNLMLKAQEVMIEAGIWEDIMSKPSKFEYFKENQ
jgi:thymidylate synthase (FAD)